MAECLGLNAKGQPCEHPVVGADGYCPAHTEGGPEHMREIAAKGGQALKERLAYPGFTEAELKPVTTLEEAQAALADVHVAVLTGRISDRVANAASKSLSEWIKGDDARRTKRMQTEFDEVIAEKDAEIAALRKQLARPMKVAS